MERKPAPRVAVRPSPSLSVYMQHMRNLPAIRCTVCTWCNCRKQKGKKTVSDVPRRVVAMQWNDEKHKEKWQRSLKSTKARGKAKVGEKAGSNPCRMRCRKRRRKWMDVEYKRMTGCERGRRKALVEVLYWR